MVEKKTRNVEISTEDLQKLIEHLRQHSEDSTRNLICFTLAKLMLECGIRMSDARLLKKPFDIAEADSPDEFILVITFAFRSFNGNEFKRAFKISKETRNLLVRVEKLYESIPISYRIDNPNSCPFVYIGQNGVVKPISPMFFEKYIKNACRDLDIPMCSFNVLRHEYDKNEHIQSEDRFLNCFKATKLVSEYWSV